MKAILKSLYKDLKELRKSQKKSQTAISEYIGFKLPSSLSHVEEGTRNVDVEKLMRWLNALNINLNDIANDSKKGFNFDLLTKFLINEKSAYKINKFMEDNLNEKKKNNKH